MGDDLTPVGQSRGLSPPTKISGGRPDAPTERRNLGNSLRYLLLRRRLDQQLANGVDATATPMLHRRAEELSSNVHRQILAHGYRRLLKHADGHPPIGLVPIDWGGVRDTRELIAWLAVRLDRETGTRVRGLALAEILLTDGASPLYRRRHESELGSAVRLTLAAL